MTPGRFLGMSTLLVAPSAVMAAGALEGEVTKQATNWTAIGMFGLFVVLTLFITKWAAGRTKSAADFYTAGGGNTRMIVTLLFFIVGSVVGVIIGGVLHWLSDKILTATTSVQVEFAMQWNTLIFVVVACGLCLVGALVPAVRAARMNITEAIVEE